MVKARKALRSSRGANFLRQANPPPTEHCCRTLSPTTTALALAPRHKPYLRNGHLAHARHHQEHFVRATELNRPRFPPSPARA